MNDGTDTCFRDLATVFEPIILVLMRSLNQMQAFVENDDTRRVH